MKVTNFLAAFFINLAKEADKQRTMFASGFQRNVYAPLRSKNRTRWFHINHKKRAKLRAKRHA